MALNLNYRKDVQYLTKQHMRNSKKVSSKLCEGSEWATKGGGGSEWEPLKNSPRREQSLCPKFNPTRLSSNRQSDVSQLVTSSP